jgi:hypothetical protein
MVITQFLFFKLLTETSEKVLCFEVIKRITFEEHFLLSLYLLVFQVVRVSYFNHFLIGKYFLDLNMV